jgi:pimeloyl-ACP methyl ester carboxylesterase
LVRFRIGLLSLCLLVIAAAMMFRPGGEARRDRGVFPTDPPTSYFHYTPSQPAKGRVLVVHGLNSNKQIMNVFSSAMAGAGFEVYSIDLPGHGDSPAGFEATRARSAVEQVLQELGDVTVIGHSLGAGLLLDLANDHDFKSMVLLSPPPTPVNRIRAERLLVFTGEYDLPRISAFVPELEEGGAKSVDIRTAPWAGHSAAVFRSDTITQIVEWLGVGATNVRIAPQLIGMALLLAWSIATGILLLSGRSIQGNKQDLAKVSVWYVGATLLATVICTAVPFHRVLGLFATDYLVGVMFVAGIILCAAFFQPQIQNARSQTAPTVGRMRVAREIAQAFLAAVYVIVVPGLLILSPVVHLTPSGGRQWRLPLIILAALPLFIADEVFIRPIRPWWKAAMIAVVTRLVLAGLTVTAALTVSRADAFLGLIIHLIAAFLIVLWFAGELVRRQVQDPIATAFFISVVYGWAAAALFVTG